MTDDAPPPLPVMTLDYAEPPPAAVTRLVRVVGWLNVVVGGLSLTGSVTALAMLSGYGRRVFGYYGPVGIVGNVIVSPVQIAAGVLCLVRSPAAARVTAIWMWGVVAVTVLNVALSLLTYGRLGPTFALIAVVTVAGGSTVTIGYAVICHAIVRRSGGHGD